MLTTSILSQVRILLTDLVSILIYRGSPFALLIVWSLFFFVLFCLDINWRSRIWIFVQLYHHLYFIIPCPSLSSASQRTLQAWVLLKPIRSTCHHPIGPQEFFVFLSLGEWTAPVLNCSGFFPSSLQRLQTVVKILASISLFLQCLDSLECLRVGTHPEELYQRWCPVNRTCIYVLYYDDLLWHHSPIRSFVWLGFLFVCLFSFCLFDIFWLFIFFFQSEGCFEWHSLQKFVTRFQNLLERLSKVKTPVKLFDYMFAFRNWYKSQNTLVVSFATVTFSVVCLVLVHLRGLSISPNRTPPYSCI